MRRLLLTPLLLTLLTTPASAHMGGIDIRALTTCKTQQAGQVCTYRDHHQNLFRGTCREVEGHEGLICAARHVPEAYPPGHRFTWAELWGGLAEVVASVGRALRRWVTSPEP